MSVFDVQKKYGIAHPLFQSNTANSVTDIERQNQNYQTRIASTGSAVPEPKKKQNVLLKTLSMLDRPRAALWNGLHDAATGQNGFLQGAYEGLTGKEDYSGKELLSDLGVKNKLAQGVGGFAAEMVLDPLNLVTLGSGSAAKGFLTGTSKTVTKELAEAGAKAALKKVTKESAEKAAITALGKEAASDVIAKETQRLLVDQANAVLKKYGTNLDASFLTKSPENILQTAKDTLAFKEAGAAKKLAGRGLSIGTDKHNISLISGNDARDAGVKAANFVKEKVPVLGKVLEGTQEVVNKVFNPKYVMGLDSGTAGAVYKFRKNTFGSKAIADDALKGKFDNFTKALGKLGIEDARKQDKLIMQVLEGTAKPEELHESIRYIMDDIAGDLKAWGLKEQDVGVLKKDLMENYAPHVLNWEGVKKSNKGGLTERLKIMNTAGFEREYRGAVDQANQVIKFRTSSDAAKEAYISSVYDMAGMPPPDKIPSSTEFANFIKEHGINMDEVAQLGNATLDGASDYFETSAVKSWMSRGLQHNKVIADKEFLDDVLAGFGTRVNNEATMRSMRNAGYDIVVPKSALSAFQLDTIDNIKLRKEFANTVGNTISGSEADVTKLSPEIDAIIKKLLNNTDSAFVNIDPSDFAKLQQSPLFVKYIPLEAYAVKGGVIEAVNKGARKQVDAGIQAIASMVDRFYSVWKPTVTGLRPDYHLRNLVGSTFNNFLDIGFKTFEPNIQAAATKLVRESASGTVTLAGKEIPLDVIRKAMVETGAGGGLRISEFTETNLNKAFNRRFESDITSGASKAAEVVKHAPSYAAKTGKAIGGAVETQVRSVNFLANTEIALEKGLTIEQAMQFAGEQVNKFHFDYTELTDAEKAIRRVMPFYTWMRKNIPLQIETLLNNPAKYTGINKYQKNIEQAYGTDSTDLPDWLKDGLAMQVGGQNKDGRVPYINASLPAADINNLGKPLQTALSALSPLIKAPLETVLNRSLLTGAPISNYEGDTQKVLGMDMNKKLANVLNQFGVFRDLSNIVTNPDQTGKTVASSKLPVASMLKQYSPAEGKVDAQYDYNRQLGNEVQKLKDTGTNVPDMNTLKKLAELDPALANIILKTGIIPDYVTNGDSPSYTKGFRARYINKAKNGGL